MTNADIAYVGLALVYAGLATGIGLGVARVLDLVRDWSLSPFVFITLVFLVLTQHPLPDRASMDCPLARATPQLQPFNFLPTVIEFIRDSAGLHVWMSNRLLLATVMNLLICMAIGAALSRHVRTIVVAAIFGTTLSLAVELTQLTGTWGIFPCAYRQFNVDDLIMNVGGVILGFTLAHRLRALW